MTAAFVASEPFKQMIISLGKLTNRNNAMNVGSSQFGYWNTRHQTNLAINESIVPGQYVYGSDYSSKLFLHQDGRVIIYNFPIEAATPWAAVSHDLSKSALKLSSVQFKRDLPFNCTLFMQKDKNIVIYANGVLPYDYSKKPAADSPMYVFENIRSMGFQAIASTRTNPGNSNAKKGLSDSTFYALVVYPKGTGASIMCDVKGGQDNLNYDHAADTQNFMLTDSRYNENCINHWAFKNTKILDITTLGST